MDPCTPTTLTAQLTAEQDEALVQVFETLQRRGLVEGLLTEATAVDWRACLARFVRRRVAAPVAAAEGSEEPE